MGFIDKWFIDTPSTDDIKQVVQKDKYLLYLGNSEMVDPKDYPHMPLSKTGAPYTYIKQALITVKEFKNKDEALKHSNEDLDNNALPMHDDLFVEFLPEEDTISSDTYYFRCLGCDRGYVLICQTQDQDTVARYWDTAVENYQARATTLVYSLLDLFLHSGSITLIQVVKSPEFKAMVKVAKEVTSPTAPEIDFLDKKIAQIDPTFSVN